MATTQQAALQLRNFGNIDPARNAESNKKSEWEKLLAQMAMAQKMDARTMAGFALGKLLRGGFDAWKENYDARGDLKTRKKSGGSFEDALGRAGFIPQQTPTSSPANFDSLPEVSAPFQNPQLLGDNVTQAADITSMLPADIDWEKALNYLRGVR